MKLHVDGLLALLLLSSLACDFRPLVGAQDTGPGSSLVADPGVGIALAGGVSHLEAGTGLSVSLGGMVSLGRFRAGLTAVDATWVPMDPEPGYRRFDIPTGAVLCQDLASGEFVDESHCPGFSDWFGAMADLSFALSRGPRALLLGGGYRVGEGRGPFFLLSWGPKANDPNGSWFAQGRIGSGFAQASGGISFWFGRRASPGQAGGAGAKRP